MVVEKETVVGNFSSSHNGGATYPIRINKNPNNSFTIGGTGVVNMNPNTIQALRDAGYIVTDSYGNELYDSDGSGANTAGDIYYKTRDGVSSTSPADGVIP